MLLNQKGRRKGIQFCRLASAQQIPKKCTFQQLQVTLHFLLFNRDFDEKIPLRLSPITVTQNTRPIPYLGSATGKEFNTYFLSSPTTRPKR